MDIHPDWLKDLPPALFPKAGDAPLNKDKRLALAGSPFVAKPTPNPPPIGKPTPLPSLKV